MGLRADIPAELGERSLSLAGDDPAVGMFENGNRITSYNVCYTKLLRIDQQHLRLVAQHRLEQRALQQETRRKEHVLFSRQAVCGLRERVGVLQRLRQLVLV